MVINGSNITAALRSRDQWRSLSSRLRSTRILAVAKSYDGSKKFETQQKLVQELSGIKNETPGIRNEFAGIRNEFADIRYELAGIKYELTKMRKIWEDILKEFKEFSGNVSRTDDEEIIEAVFQHLIKNGFCTLGPPSLNRKIFSEGVQQCKIDGLITLGGKSVAVVKAKFRVTKEDVMEILKASSVLMEVSGFVRVMMFVGGLLIDDEAKCYALQNGINGVEISKHQYQVVNEMDWRRQHDFIETAQVQQERIVEDLG